jgi:hypothetical protein
MMRESCVYMSVRDDGKATGPVATRPEAATET